MSSKNIPPTPRLSPGLRDEILREGSQLLQKNFLFQ
jgi:hypothetical protein